MLGPVDTLLRKQMVSVAWPVLKMKTFLKTHSTIEGFTSNSNPALGLVVATTSRTTTINSSIATIVAAAS